MKSAFFEQCKKYLRGSSVLTPGQLESINCLAMNLSSGLPMLHALDVTRRCIPSKEYRKAMDALYKALAEGIPMSDALKQPQCAILPALVKIVLLTDITDVEKGEILYRKYTKSVFDIVSLEDITSYITAAGSMFVLLSFALFRFVLPQFGEIYAAMAIPLPGITRCLLSIARFCNIWAPIILLVALAIIAVIIFIYNTPVFNRIWFGFIGVRKAVFSEILYVLSSVPPERTLEFMKALADSPLFNEAKPCMTAFREALESGAPVDAVLIRNGIEPQAAWLVRLAVEGRGRPESFALAAELIENRLIARNKEMLTIAKVLIVVAYALLVGIIAFGVFKPLVYLTWVA